MARAKELVEEGDEIYSKAYEKVSSYASETEYRIIQHDKFKKELLQKLGRTTKATMISFKNFNIDSKIDRPDISSSASGFQGDLQSFSNITSSIIANPFPMDAVSFLFDEVDLYEAKRTRDEARRYKDRMRGERDKLYAYKDKMSEIRTFIDQEKETLNKLAAKLERGIDELNKGMTKSSFTEDEAIRLKGINKIIEMLYNTLSTNFIDNNCMITNEYKKNYDLMVDLNSQIPESPDTTDWIGIFRTITGV